jgi:hypothetical protein
MKSFIAGLVMSILLVSCAVPVTTSYATRENWISVDDLMRVQENNDVVKWGKDLGKPVVIELNKDTTFYYYHFKPYLYRTWNKQNGLYKPTEEDNTGTWSGRNEMMRIALLNGKVISIKKSNTFLNEPFFGTQQTVTK